MIEKAFIKSLAYYLPEETLGNDELQASFNSQIKKEDFDRLGISHRTIAGKGITASEMAFQAALRLFSENKIDKSQIDALVYCSLHADYITPPTSCILHQKLGLRENAATYDLHHGCSGYIYGLSIAKALIEGLKMKTVLFLTGSTLTKYLNKKDKASRMVFGDGASATLISSGDQKSHIGNFIYGTDGNDASKIMIKDGGEKYPLSESSFIEKKDEYENIYSDANFYMDGVSVFLFTMEKVPPLIEETLGKNNLQQNEIDLYILHQANNFVNEQIRKKMGIAPEKFFYYVENCGNTVQSTIPIALHEAIRTGKAKKGDKILLAGFGVGLSWAATVVTL